MSRAAGREAEFVEFASAAAPRLRRTAYLMCGDWHLAEDLTQTALAKVYVAWRRNGAPDEPFAYARTALLRTLLDHQRRRSTSEVPVAELPEQAGAADDDLRLTMLGGLARLATDERTVLVLRYWEDLSVAQVADVLRLTPSAVKSRSSRALGKLADVLGQDAVPARVRGG